MDGRTNRSGETTPTGSIYYLMKPLPLSLVYYRVKPLPLYAYYIVKPQASNVTDGQMDGRTARQTFTMLENMRTCITMIGKTICDAGGGGGKLSRTYLTTNVIGRTMALQ